MSMIPLRPSVTTTAGQTARAFHGLRFRLAHNVIQGVLSGSRLRLSMVVICTTIFWAGLFFLFFGERDDDR